MFKIKYQDLVAGAEDNGELNEITYIDRGNYYCLFYKGGYAEAPKLGDQSFLDKLPDMNNPVRDYAFKSKIISGGKKLFKRVHGVNQSCSSGTNTIDFIVPYNQAKLESVEILWCPKGCIANLNVYDNSSGTISGVPSLKLNQFGYDVNLREEYHVQKSQYDADVILGMKIELSIELPSSVTGSIDIGFNIELNEVV